MGTPFTFYSPEFYNCIIKASLIDNCQSILFNNSFIYSSNFSQCSMISGDNTNIYNCIFSNRNMLDDTTFSLYNCLLDETSDISRPNIDSSISNVKLYNTTFNDTYYINNKPIDPNPYFVGILEEIESLSDYSINKLFIDTTPVTGGLKYYNGSEWVAVPFSI